MKIKFLQFRLLITATAIALLHTTTVWAQEPQVSGSVTTAEDNNPLPGVSVVVKGTTRGTSTDADGRYAISVPSESSVLTFSFIGYKPFEVVVGSQTVINVVLEADIGLLSEVVVVGYGTVKKSDVTGALVSVSADVLTERPVQNVFQALQGKAAGVNISTNMKPGELPVIRVRGNRSMGVNGASNEPLYVVDGIPIVNVLGVTSFSIADINPNDISSIEILKDASATAIYGSRGANGVVLITTKKGRKGKVDVTYTGTYSMDSYKPLTNWMTGGEYIDRWRLAEINGRRYKSDIPDNADLNAAPKPWFPDPALDVARFGLPVGSQVWQAVMSGYEWEDQIGGTVRMRPTTAAEQAMGWPAEVPVYNSANVESFDWLDEATRTGITNNHQLAFSSGTENSQLYMSLGYFDQKGVQKDQDYHRYNVSINGQTSATRWLTFGTSILASHARQNFGITPPNRSNTGAKDFYSRAASQFPFERPWDENGNLIRQSILNGNLFSPLRDLDQSKNERRTSSVMANLFAEVRFTPWLKYRANLGSQYRHFRNGQWTGPNYTGHLSTASNIARYNAEEHFSWVLENLLFADKTFNDHAVGITLLQSAQNSRRENLNVNADQSIYETSLWYDLASSVRGNPQGYGSGFTENTLMSWMGRVNYSFKDKYLLTATGRYDGASVLAPGNKWDFFPSFAVAWKMHEETFLSAFDWLDTFKPRFGYGVTGNSSVQPYTTSGPLIRASYAFGPDAAIGFLPRLVQNPDLGWEKTAQWNAGLDFSVLKGRVSGAVEFYDAKTSDLILSRDLPAVSGYVRKFENIGKTRNRGVEITLSTVNVAKGDFTWSMDVNWSKNKEEIVELFNKTDNIIGNGWFIGQPVSGVYYQIAHDGIWQNTPADLEEMAKFNAAPGNHRFYPGAVKPVDLNGDYRINADDRVIVGNNRPKWYGGITNTFTYKNWTLSSLIYARVGQTYFGTYPNSYGGIFPNGRVENDIWSFDNPNGRWPMPNTGNVENLAHIMQYGEGSFAVVRNISLSYRLPEGLLQKISAKDVQVTFQVLNPFIFGGEVVKMGINPDDDTDWDAANNQGSPLGGTNNNTILQQSFVLGLRAGF